MTTTRYRVQSLDCAEEATTLRNTVGKLPGVAELSFDVLRGMMIVEHDPAISDERIVETVARTGMRAEVWQDTAQAAGRQDGHGRRWKTWTTIGSGAALGLGFVIHGILTGWVVAIGAADAHIPSPRSPCIS